MRVIMKIYNGILCVCLKNKEKENKCSTLICNTDSKYSIHYLLHGKYKEGYCCDIHFSNIYDEYKTESIEYVIHNYIRDFCTIADIIELMLENKYLYKIGSLIKYNVNVNNFQLKAIATYTNTCDSARSAIRIFCLFCIRFEPYRLNKDVRKKISKLIWEDRISFIPE